MTEQPPSYPPPPPGGYGSPPPGGYGSPPPGGYGYPPPGPGYPPPQGVGTNGMAIASLVCSLVGWVCFIGPILGIIFGLVALGQIKQTGQGGRGMALAGIIVGVAVIVLGIGLAILSALVGSHTSGTGAPAVVMTVAPQAVSHILMA